MRLSKGQLAILIAPGAAVIVLGLLVPLLYFLRFSLAEPSRTGFANPGLSVDNFVQFFTSRHYVSIYAQTVTMAAVASVINLLLAMPVALYLSRCRGWKKDLLLVAAFFPLLVGGVVRSIGWVAATGYDGLLNSILSGIGLLDAPRDFSHNAYSVTLALGLLLVPICIIILTSAFDSFEPSVERASHDLGAGPLRTFVRVLLPQLVPGILAATSLVFVLNMNAYSTPVLVGGPSVQMLSTTMYSTMISANNWPLGSAIALIMVTTALGAISLYSVFVRQTLLRWK